MNKKDNKIYVEVRGKSRVYNPAGTKPEQLPGDKLEDVMSQPIQPDDKSTSEPKKEELAPKPALSESAQDKQSQELLQQEQESGGVKIVSENNTSLNFAAIGVGQGGSRIAEMLYKYGYPAAVLNTAKQDLEYIEVPESNKLFIDFALGGVGKDLNLGQEAIENYTAEVKKFVSETFANETIQYFLLCVTGGGGTGSGSTYPMVRILSELYPDIPISVIYTLPKNNEGPVANSNALTTLQKLAAFSVNKKIAGLVVVDNSKIEELYPDLPVSKFWEVANRSIIDVLHSFNSLSEKATPYDSLDPMDFARIFSAGNCTVYGRATVTDLESETALADALVEAATGGLLAEGFDLKSAEQTGIIITGSAEVLSNLKADAIEYAVYELGNQVGSAGIYRGIYPIETNSKNIEIYAMYSGLGIPRERVDTMIKQNKTKMAEMDAKSSDTSKMDVSFESDTASNKQDQKFKRIGRGRSAFGRITGKSRRRLKDRR